MNLPDRSLLRPHTSAVRIILFIILLVGIGEVVDHLLALRFSSDSTPLHIVVQSLLVSVIVAPFLYLYVIRPMISLNQERLRGLEQLKRANDMLTESEQRFRTIADASPAMIWQSDRTKGCIYFNASWLAYTGRTLEQELGNGWADGLHPDDYERCFDVYSRKFDARMPFEMEYRLKRKDGSYGWVLDHGLPAFSPSGVFMGMTGSCVDITARKLAEQEVADSQFRYQSIVEGTNVGTWEWNVQTGETIFNERWAEIIGYRLEELAPVSIETWKRILHPEDEPEVIRKLRDHFDGKSRHYDAEFRVKHRNGQWIWIHDRGRVMTRTAEGKPLMMYGTHTDITDRKGTEEALKETNYRITNMFEKHSSIMLLIDPASGRIVDANDSAQRFYGYSKAMLCSMNIDRINALPPEEVRRKRTEAATDTANRFRFPHRLASGEIRTVEVDSTLISLWDDSILFSIIHDITDQVRMEALLKESDEKFRSFFEQSNDGITLIDEQGRIIEWNNAMERITGIPCQEAHGAGFIDLQARLSVAPVTEDLLQQQRSQLLDACATGASPFFHRTIEAPFRTANGEQRSIQQVLFPIRTGAGFRIGMVSRDITEKAAGDRAVAQTRSNYESFFNTIDEFLFVLDMQGNILFTNRTVIDRLGYGTEELRGVSVLQVHPEERRQEASHIVGEMLQGRMEHCPIPLQRKDGLLIPVETRVKLGTWNDQPVIFGISKDISRLTLSEEKFSKLFYLNPSACGLSELGSGNYVEVNQAFEELLGFSRDEVVGRSAYDLKILTRDVAQAIVSKADKNGRIVNAEAQLRTKTGTMRDVIMSAENIIVQDRKFRFTIVNDITELKQAQAAAAQMAQRNEILLHTSKDGIHVMDERGYLVEVNETFCEMLGVGRAEALSMNVRNWDARWSGDELMQKIDALLRQPAVFETVHRRKDGSEFPVEVNAVGVTLEGKRLLYASARDITERRAMEEAHRHSQKLESIGTLAGGIAHDFNNLLVAILGQASLAYDRMRKDDPSRPNIEKVITASEHAADLTRQLLAYSGQGKFFTEQLDVNRLIRENVQMFELSLPKNCRLSLYLDPADPAITADKGQMQQVLMNLIINAGEAIGERNGEIMLRTDVRTVADGDLRYARFTNTALTGGEYVVITVEDTGSGISAHQLQRIFDPFFTTKFTGRGLGLSAVLGIIRGHHGGLAVTSTEGVGTTFEVLFPLSRTDRDPSAGSDAEKPGRAGTILLIDDEPTVLEFLNDALTDDAYTVLQSRDPVEGIELFRSHWQDIALVILDYAMPFMNGYQVFQELVRIDPRVTVLLSSGYSEEYTMEHFGHVRPAAFFQKPFSARALREKVHTMTGMDQSKAGGPV
ncbi:MAG: PAS domain S-box protein [Bacteroidetes bacterium]|nr:PAS domain S-box protein [Bacteroidota bacterium]